MRRDIDRALADLAATQFGAIARSQAHSVGANDALLRRRVAAGALHGLTEHVFRISGYPASFEQSLWLATLDCEGESFVSHHSAARLHGLPSFTAVPKIVLTVPHGDKRTPLAMCHQTRRALADLPLMLSTIGLQVSPLALNLAELATVVTPQRLSLVVEHVLTTRRSRYETLVDAWRDARARHLDVRALGAILARLGPDADLPTSVLNGRLHAVLDQVPGPPASYETAFPGSELPNSVVDALLMPELIIVEGDGRSWHTREKDFVRDRQRDRAAAKVGYVTIRYSYAELADIAGVIEEITDLRIQRRRDLGLSPIDVAA